MKAGIVLLLVLVLCQGCGGGDDAAVPMPASPGTGVGNGAATEDENGRLEELKELYERFGKELSRREQQEVDVHGLLGRFFTDFEVHEWSSFLASFERLQHQQDSSWALEGNNEAYGYYQNVWGKGAVDLGRVGAAGTGHGFEHEVPVGTGIGDGWTASNRLTVHHAADDPYIQLEGMTGTILDVRWSLLDPGLNPTVVPVHGLPFSRTRSYLLIGELAADGGHVPMGYLTVMDNRWTDDRLGKLADAWLGWGTWARRLPRSADLPADLHRVDVGSFVVMSEATYERNGLVIPAIGPWSPCPRLGGSGALCGDREVLSGGVRLTWEGSTTGTYAFNQQGDWSSGLFKGRVSVTLSSGREDAGLPEVVLSLGGLEPLASGGLGTAGGLPVTALTYDIGGSALFALPANLSPVSIESGLGTPLGSFAGQVEGSESGRVTGFAKGSFLGSVDLRVRVGGGSSRVLESYWEPADHVAGIYNYGLFSEDLRGALNGSFAASRVR